MDLQFACHLKIKKRKGQKEEDLLALSRLVNLQSPVVSVVWQGLAYVCANFAGSQVGGSSDPMGGQTAVLPFSPHKIF